MIISLAHICRNPRVYKEAVTLSSAGYDVTIVTGIHSDELLKEDLELLDGNSIKYLLAFDLRNKSLKNYLIKLIRAINVKLVKYLNLQVPGALGYNLNGYNYLLNSTKADLFIAHQELPLYLGCRLIKRGRKVAFDIEDWYSEDLLPEAKQGRPIKLLKKSECFALKNGAFTQTTSHALADALANEYNTKKPFVIYNKFNIDTRTSNNTDRKNPNAISLIWFSQTVGPGRGLETIIETIKNIKHPVELHLRGNCSSAYSGYLTDLLGVQPLHHLYIHPLVKNEELAGVIKGHDIGLAFEDPEPPNKDLTASNKIFHYLVNCVPVIASPTKGQKEVAAMAEKCVFVTKDFTSDALSETINGLIENPDLLRIAKQTIVLLSEKICWKFEEVKLLNQIAAVFEQ